MISFFTHENIIIKGKVFSGKKDSGCYLRLNWVKQQLLEKVGFIPYPGTLNLKLDNKYVKAKKLLKGFEGIAIVPKLGYCPGKCYRAKFRSAFHCAVILPELVGYPEDVLELISPTNLREKFQLNDGDSIEIEVCLTPQFRN